jgi:hypothetical protein
MFVSKGFSPGSRSLSRNPIVGETSCRIVRALLAFNMLRRINRQIRLTSQTLKLAAILAFLTSVK